MRLVLCLVLRHVCLQVRSGAMVVSPSERYYVPHIRHAWLRPIQRIVMNPHALRCSQRSMPRPKKTAKAYEESSVIGLFLIPDFAKMSKKTAFESSASRSIRHHGISPRVLIAAEREARPIDAELLMLEQHYGETDIILSATWRRGLSLTVPKTANL